MKNLKNKRVSFDPPAKSPNKNDRLEMSRMSSTSINGTNIDEKLGKHVFGKSNTVSVAKSLEVSDAD